MESTFERRMLEIASDILLAVSRGELAPDSAVVGAAAHAIARLRPDAHGAGALTGEARRTTAASGGLSAASGPTADLPPAAARAARSPAARPVDLAAHGASPRAPRMVPPIEHVLAVAALMRAGRLPFAAACARRAAETGVSAQAVRNACCRWLDLSAYDWQPLCTAGSDEAALLVARRVVDRQGWAARRVAETFALDEGRLG